MDTECLFGLKDDPGHRRLTPKSVGGPNSIGLPEDFFVVTALSPSVFLSRCAIRIEKRHNLVLCHIVPDISLLLLPMQLLFL
ncbi:hypothetical protein MP638_001619, partial [Amoeboaphelidium occidentale]